MDDRPTLLLVGAGEPMDAALRAALTRYRLTVETSESSTVIEAVLAAAPDLVLLVGDAALDGGASVLALLASNPATSVVPVAVLSEDASLDRRMRAFRAGAVALVPREASADGISKKVADLARELPERSGEASGELGEATLDELIELVKNELKTGILSVEASDSSVSPAYRIVLGAGRPVQEAMADFVARLRPLVAKAEPLRYELFEDSGGRLQLLDPEDTGEGDLAVLSGLRILVVDDDPGRADALAQELRARGATVAVTDVTGRGLERARTLDPEVVIVDAAGLEGPGFEVVRTLRRDPHLRWAQLLVASWDEIWPDRTGRPDVHRLAHRITPLVEQDAELRARALKVASFDTRLEITGPSRLLRALAAVPGPLHITVRNPKALVELDLAEGLVVGARAATLAGELEGKATIEGSTAIAALLVLSTGRVRVEKRDNPEIANMMTPVDEAVAEAALLDSPIPPSLPPAARERDGTERIEVGEGARPRAPEASPKPLARVAPVKKVIRTPPSKASSTAKPVPPPKPPALPPNPNTARKKTMLGVPSGSKPMAPPAPARITSAQQQVGTLRGIPSPPAPEPVEAALPSFDSAPTVAPPPHVSEELVEASKENGARAEGAGGPLKVDAMPGGAEDDVNEPTIPHHHAAREVDPTTKTEDASMIELADGPHPAGAPSAPASVEALADPTIETPPPHGPDAEGLGLPRLRPERSSEHPDRPPRGRSRVMLGGVVFLLLACAAAAAVMLVPDLRVRVFGPESIVTEPRTVAAAGAGAGPSVATPDDTEARTGAPAVAETAADDTAAEATAETETNADDTAAQATTTTDPDTDPDTEAATDTDTDTEAATAMESAALPPEVRALSPTALVSRGDAALREERLAEAEALYRLALEKDPRENHAMAGLAELFVTRGNGGQAVEWAERAVQLRRRRTAYRVILGDAYRIAGREDDARREYYTALRDEPRNPGALRGLTALRAE